MTALAARDVVIRRAARTVLDGITLSARQGEFIAVVGANGAGKSTLLSVLAGLVEPDAGSVTLDGQVLRSIRPKDLARQRAYLPQNPRCEWPIPVERLVALGLTPSLPAFGLPKAFQPRIEAALRHCDLLDRREQPATTLSGGELARAMLARAMVGEPALLIVDEPMTGLDPRHALDTAARLEALARGGTCVIAAVHDLTLAMRHATRIVALKGGRIAADGPRAEVLTPALLRAVFDVEASVVRTEAGFFIDYRGVREL